MPPLKRPAPRIPAARLPAPRPHPRAGPSSATLRDAATRSADAAQHIRAAAGVVEPFGLSDPGYENASLEYTDSVPHAANCPASTESGLARERSATCTVVDLPVGRGAGASPRARLFPKEAARVQ